MAAGQGKYCISNGTDAGCRNPPPCKFEKLPISRKSSIEEHFRYLIRHYPTASLQSLNSMLSFYLVDFKLTSKCHSSYSAAEYLKPNEFFFLRGCRLICRTAVIAARRSQ
jgi:hypothetical protein